MIYELLQPIGLYFTIFFPIPLLYRTYWNILTQTLFVLSFGDEFARHLSINTIMKHHTEWSCLYTCIQWDRGERNIQQFPSHLLGTACVLPRKYVWIVLLCHFWANVWVLLRQCIGNVIVTSWALSGYYQGSVYELLYFVTYGPLPGFYLGSA